MVARVVAVALMTGVKSALEPLTWHRQPLIAFYFAVLFTAWYGGFGPSVAAILLSCLSATYWFFPPHFSISIRDPGDLFALGTFVVISAAIVGLSEATRAARRLSMREAADREDAERGVKDSEERFQQLFNTMPQIVWAAEPEGSVVYFNGRWYEYTGLAPDESRSHEAGRGSSIPRSSPVRKVRITP